MPEPTASKPALLPVLRAHTELISDAEVPVGARHRIAARLAEEARTRAEPTPSRRWIPMVTFAAGAALVMLVAGYNLARSGGDAAQQVQSASVATLAGYTVHGESCQRRLDGDAAVLAGECRLVGPHLAVQTWDDVRLVPSERTVVLRTGQAMFDVQTVAPGETPVRVQVSHGIIEVLGTRFTVDQGPAGGTVDLFEGHIRFRPRDDADGEWIDIQPGQRYAWGDRADLAVAVVADASEMQDEPEPELMIEIEDEEEPPRRPKAAVRLDADEIIDRVTELRGMGHYAQAVAVLRKALRQRWDRRTGQVLSYELGQILERHRHDPAAACRHWRRHQRRYPEGRYAGAVATSLRRGDP